MLVFKKASITSDITLALTKVLLWQGHVKIIRARTFWGPFINFVTQEWKGQLKIFELPVPVLSHRAEFH